MQSLILTALNSCFERLWCDLQDLQHRLHLARQKVPLFGGGPELQNKMQPVIRAWRRFVYQRMQQLTASWRGKKISPKMENKWGDAIKQQVGWWLYWLLSPEQEGKEKKEKVLPSPLIYPAQKTRWLCTNVKRHKLILCYVRTVTKRRNKQPSLGTDHTSTWNLRRCGLKEHRQLFASLDVVDTTVCCASVLCRTRL